MPDTIAPDTARSAAARAEHAPRASFSRRGVLAGASSLAVLSAAGCAGESAGQKPVVDENAHPLSGLARFNGDAIPLPELVGRITVLDFWASWCAPCRQAFRYMDQLYGTYRRDGLQLIAISVDTDPDAAQRFRARLRPRFPTAWDRDGLIKERFKVYSLPTTLVIDENVRVAHRHEGFDPRSHELLESYVQRLVSTP